MVRVFINAGHSCKNDPGAINKSLNLQERYVTRDLCNAVSVNLGLMGIETACYQQVDSLNEVPKKANDSKADLFVSIHMNASTSNSASGVEVLFCEGSKAGESFAQNILSSIVKIGSYTFKDRGVKNDSSRHLCVLRKTDMTACLVEMGFISNNQEAYFVASHISECGKAIADGILKYIIQNNLIKDTINIENTPTKPLSIIIIPSGVNGTYNLQIENKVILVNNSIETINKYLLEKYKNELYHVKEVQYER